MLQAILNKSWGQHPTKQQLYGHLPPISKTIKIRRTRHAGNCWRRRDELISDVLLWTPSQDDQLEPTYNSSVTIRDVALRTCQKQWTIGRGRERGSGRSVLIVQHDDDDENSTDVIHDIFISTTCLQIVSSDGEQFYVITVIPGNTFYRNLDILEIYINIHNIKKGKYTTHRILKNRLNSKYYRVTYPVIRQKKFER